MLKLRSVLWTDWVGERAIDFHGVALRKYDRAAQLRIVHMLRSMPKKWDRNKGRTGHIFALPEVTSEWY